MTTFFSFAFLAASVFGKMIALPMSMLALHACTHDSHYGVGLHACTHDSHYGVGKEFPQHSTQKPLTISGGTGMEHVGILWGTGGEPVGILWGTGGEPGMIFGEPGFGGCLAP